MKKAYLLVYADQFGTREEVKGYVDAIDEIITWRYDLPHAFYLISEASANQLVERLNERSGGKEFFLVTEIGDNRQGWITPDSWYLIINKAHPPTS